MESTTGQATSEQGAVSQAAPVTGTALKRSAADEICAVLLERERLKQADLRRAEAYRDQHGGDLVTLLVRLGLVSEKDVAEAEAEMLDLPLVRTGDLPEDYGIKEAHLFNIRPPVSETRAAFPQTQTTLVNLMSGFDVDQGMLLPDGRLEVLLTASDPDNES